MTIEYKDSKRIVALEADVATTEQAFSFTTTDTVNALWGNRIYGMKLLSGHSGLNKYIKKAKTYHPTNPTGSRLTTGTLYHVILDSSGTEIARSAGVSASSVSNNSWAETTLSSPVKLLENYTVGMTISTGDANTYLGIGVNNNSSSPTNTTRYYKDESGNVGLSTSETMLMVFDSAPSSNKPTNVQDNFILVEKDTAKRYWGSLASETTASDSVTDTSGGQTLYSGSNIISAEKFTTGADIIGKVISKVEFPIYKQGTGGGGTATAGVFDSSGNTLFTFGTLLASTVADYATPFTWYSFENLTGYTISANEYIGLKYDAGDSSNRLIIRTDDASPPYADGVHSHFTSSWADETGADQSFKAYSKTGYAWTMQPTWRDDFSSDNWTDSSGSITVVNTTTGKLDWDFIKDSSNNQTAYDFTTPVNDSKWVLRFELTTDNISNTSSSSLWGQIGLFSEDETSDSGNAENGIMLNLLRTSSGTSNYKVGGLYNATNISAAYATFSRALAAETVFVELKRISPTLVEASLFEDSAYSNLLETQQYTISSSIVDLQYIKVLNYNTGNVGGTLNGTIDNMEFYNEVSSVN